MSKLRLLFEKQGTACYISHLDLMRTFQRLFCGAACLSSTLRGFIRIRSCPFCSRCRWEQSSCCELLDFEVESAVDLETLPALLNAGCPEGLRVSKSL